MSEQTEVEKLKKEIRALNKRIDILTHALEEHKRQGHAVIRL